MYFIAISRARSALGSMKIQPAEIGCGAGVPLISR